MIAIDFEEPTTTQCECCGSNTTKLVRYVSRDSIAHAVYLASFTPGHERKAVHIIIGLGPWGEDAPPSARTAFVADLWDNNGEWAVTVVNKDQSAWGGVEFLGVVLDRQEALAHPWIKEIFHITDHIVAEDRPVIDYFR